MRIALGSTSDSKVRAARAVFGRAFPGAEVTPVEVASAVDPQPTSDEETIRGALHRAHEARNQTGADLGVGIEGGVQRDARGVWVTAWVAVVDAAGREGLGSGVRFRLPEWIARRTLRGEELGAIVDTHLGAPEAHETWGAIGLLTAGLVDRQAALEQAIAAALPPFLRSPLSAIDGLAGTASPPSPDD
jgi:inosine/xanthosine triphosphatase